MKKIHSLTICTNTTHNMHQTWLSYKVINSKNSRYKHAVYGSHCLLLKEVWKTLHRSTDYKIWWLTCGKWSIYFHVSRHGIFFFPSLQTWTFCFKATYCKQIYNMYDTVLVNSLCNCDFKINLVIYSWASHLTFFCVVIYGDAHILKWNLISS